MFERLKLFNRKLNSPSKIRVYQPSNALNYGCNPPGKLPFFSRTILEFLPSSLDFPTEDYINTCVVIYLGKISTDLSRIVTWQRTRTLI